MARTITRNDGRSKRRPGPERQREKIVEAAVDLFIERGVEAVSISEICVGADVGRQTFYRCFEDKDSLIAHLYQHTINEHIEAALERMSANPMDDQWASAVIEQVIDAILEQPKLAMLLYVEATKPGSLASEVTDAAMEKAARVIRSWFSQEMGEKPSKSYVKSLLAATTWLVHNAIVAGRSKKAVIEAKRSSALLFEGLFLTMARRDKRSAISAKFRPGRNAKSGG